MAYFKIDYYSFTIPIKGVYHGINDISVAEIVQTFISVEPSLSFSGIQWENFQIERAKGFYSYRLRCSVTGVALSVGSVNAHILVEFSGKACDNLDSIDALKPIILATRNRASRIDIALDFECETTPAEFAELRNKARWKFAPFYPSASGETVYIGSRSGERMARVYRYNAPHPRSHLLRVECEYKGDAAKALAASSNILNEEVLFAVASAPFGFTHPLYTDRQLSADKLPYRKNSEKNKNTVAWLYGAVISSMRRAISESVVDFEEWKSALFNVGSFQETVEKSTTVEVATNTPVEPEENRTSTIATTPPEGKTRNS